MSTTKRRERLAAALVATVTAATLAGSAVAARQAAPTNTASPTITGNARVGQTLTASDGTWSNAPTSYAYQWVRCNSGGAACVNAANGTQKSYTLVGADRAHTMRVKVTATNTDGSASAQSDPTPVVQPAAASTAPKNTSAPSISGSAQVGEELDVDGRHVDGRPGLVHVRVAALRCGRRRLHERRRRNR